MMNLGSLCTGVGGIELGLGIEADWVADNDKYASVLINKRFPGVPNLGDIKTIDWQEVRRMGANPEAINKADHTRLHRGVMPNDEPAVDILTAGYP